MARTIRLRVRSNIRKARAFEKSGRQADNVLGKMTFGKAEKASTFMELPDPMEGYEARPKCKTEVWRRE